MYSDDIVVRSAHNGTGQQHEASNQSAGQHRAQPVMLLPVQQHAGCWHRSEYDSTYDRLHCTASRRRVAAAHACTVGAHCAARAAGGARVRFDSFALELHAPAAVGIRSKCENWGERAVVGGDMY